MYCKVDAVLSINIEINETKHYEKKITYVSKHYNISY